MIFANAAEFEASSFQPKVCIVGAGPAGITIARVLAKLGTPVVILEAGGEEVTEESQDFYRGTTVGDPYFDLDVARLRFLGGCSNHWAGWCRVLDASDFEARPWVPDSGWPIGRHDIEPFLGEVQDILDLPAFEADRPIDADISWIQLIKSPAVRFGQKYREEIATSDRIALVLNTHVTELVGDGTQVTAARIRSNGAPARDLRVAQYVVATGGLENSRLLLWSNERSGGGVVPKPAALGRYWMEHPQFIAADALLLRENAFEMDAQNEAFFGPSPAALQRAGIMNFGVRLISTPYAGVKETVAHLACTAPSFSEWASSTVGLNLTCGGHLSVGWEQAPVAENRVALSGSERDADGIPRIELHWKKGELDRRTLLEGLRLFGQSMARADLGRVRLAEWLLEGEEYPEGGELAGYHHMGGTRMSNDPQKGVVDSDCRVHGMRNLHIGGSSVFATSGHANPTTTIVALALRLGYHLSGLPHVTA
ncbi:GMC oxidoreductase [Mangrovicella endophytica]|uniref:GMC oxidoreductase n=1 Tax=Mangrovicella endophytica TaxID=2066697 RepID=UPI000C9EAFC3|nr:GMC family oxidoreductase [Mangrovicella endophytica]